jgi:phosphoenolpyruvate synthase/pyruvate phosphate dikinase
VSVLALEDGPPADARLIGGKARGLADLIRLGLPVPPAAVLTTEAHERYREQGTLAEGDRAALAAAVERLGTPLAVRSSAADEDAADRSAAGQYDTVMGLEALDAVAAAVEHCWRQAEGGRALAYRDGTPARVALVIQREVEADRAGVAFSVDPVTGSDAAVVVEAVFGHGHGAVGGAVTPDRYRVERDSGAVAARVADKEAAANAAEELSPLPPERRTARVLRDDEARAVAGLVATAEDGLAARVDIEFCFAHGELWAVQCRPITALR